MTGQPPEPGWLGRLEPGETLLWQGRPDARLVFVWRHTVEALLAVGFAVGALVLLAMLVLIPLSLLSLAFLPGIAFFGAVAFFLGPWMHLRDARIRRDTRYALTDRRAVIARADRAGRVTVQSYPITATSPIGTTWNGVGFARIRQRRGGRMRDVAIGFDRITPDDAQTVHAHLMAIRRAALDRVPSG